MRVATDPPIPKEPGSLTVFLLVGLAALGASRLACEPGGHVATIWPVNGLLLAVLLTTQGRRWPAYLIVGYLANVAANSLGGGRLPLTVALPFCNTVEVLTSAVLIRKYATSPFDLRQGRTFWTFVLFGVGVAPALSAVLATVFILLQSPNSSWSNSLLNWYVSDALGTAAATPFVWAWQEGSLGELFKGKSVTRSAGVLGLLAVGTTLVFVYDSPTLLFLVFPLLVLVVFRLGLAGAALGVFLVAGVAFGFSFGAPTLGDHTGRAHWTLVLYVSAALGTTLPLALLLEGRKSLERSLRSSEALYRRLFEAAKDGILILDAETTEIVDVNPFLCDLLDLSRDDVLGRQLWEVVPFRDVSASVPSSK